LVSVFSNEFIELKSTIALLSFRFILSPFGCADNITASSLTLINSALMIDFQLLILQFFVAISKSCKSSSAGASAGTSATSAAGTSSTFTSSLSSDLTSSIIDITPFSSVSYFYHLMQMLCL
jgi:hypothetical protein